MTHHTPGTSDFLVWTNLGEQSPHLIFRFLTHTTRIDDNDICIVSFINMLPPTVGQNGFDTGSITIIHLTPKYYTMKFHRKNL